MKQKISKIIALIITVLYCIFFIYLLKSITDFVTPILLSMLLAIPFMVITHEAGHLICGLLTGYRFVSFRVFSVMLLRENGKLKWKKHKVPGTAGQCLMAPPQKENGNYPYQLYNLGGILVCGILSIIPILRAFFLFEYEFIAMPLFIFGFVSFFMNLMNAIPTNGKSMINDATNLLMAKRSTAGREAFWNQLEYVHLHSQNVRTADMPETIFFHPHENDLGNTLVQWQSLENIERFEDMGDYEKAQKEVYDVLEKAPFLSTFYENYFKMEVIYLGALLGNDQERVEQYVKELQKRNQVKNTIPFARAYYAYCKLVQKDPSVIQNARTFFEKKIRAEAYLASAVFERRQLAYIDSLTK